jgi:hypothetical protein
MTVLANSAAGQIQGGWEYVIASYAVVWITFGAYALSLYVRSRQQES